MSGQPTPPRLSEAFALNAGVGYITTPIPTPSQIGISNGRASLNDGFPPVCFLDLSAGGIPPDGRDVNGILYMLSSWAAYLAAGQLPSFDAALATAMTGYALGATVQSATAPQQLWTAMTAGLANDPNSDPTGWRSSIPLHATSAPTAGAHNNVTLPGYSDYVLDVDTTAGAMSFTGFVPQCDGQRAYVTPTGANSLTFVANSGASTSPLRIPIDLTALQNQTYTFQYQQSANVWVLI